MPGSCPAASRAACTASSSASTAASGARPTTCPAPRTSSGPGSGWWWCRSAGLRQPLESQPARPHAAARAASPSPGSDQRTPPFEGATVLKPTLWAVLLWIVGLLTIVPYGIYHLIFHVEREHLAFNITLVLFWIFGYWGVVGPILAAIKVRAAFRALERAHAAGRDRKSVA